MDGILNINKPPSRTSFQIVSLVRRLSRCRRVGHAGTLDPAATGVLPIALGQGTRVIEFLTEATKTYRAQIELGIVTDTYDAQGKVTATHDPSLVTREQLERALAPFRGLIQQLPPMYSAARYRGRHLYELARAGIEVERRRKTARVLRLELLEWQPPLVTVEVECGKGTYIRSLAHDLGQVLGCGAHVRNLVRTTYGLFHIEEALSIPQLENAFARDYWQSLLYPIDIVLGQWPAVTVDKGKQGEIGNGCPVPLDGVDGAAGARCRAYCGDGLFLAVLRFDAEKGLWHPDKVFPTPDS
jgi:tRNA pseudouridine55 synthase